MSKQVLSIEQMQHLEELGVDTSKANFYWHRTKSLNNYNDWDEALKTQWIMVDERKPNENEKVFVLFEYNGMVGIDTDVYFGDDFYNFYKDRVWNYGGEKIIAWMPIPSFDEILEASKDVFKRLKSK